MLRQSIGVILGMIHKIGLTLQRTFAISKVPTVSILAAIMGMPLYICFEFRNKKDLVRSTYRHQQDIKHFIHP